MERGRGDQVVQHVRTFTEMKSVEHREARHAPAVLQDMKISLHQYVVTDESLSTVLN